jgi:hypothetical protein
VGLAEPWLDMGLATPRLMALPSKMASYATVVAHVDVGVVVNILVIGGC